jgi:hypothetical protein
MSLFTFKQDRAGAFGPVKRRWVQNSGLLITLSCALLPVLSGCGNPAVDVIVATLGDDNGRAPSADHRQGQPCVACHGPYYGASPRMSLAGTIFGNPTADVKTLVPVNNATIRIFDTGTAGQELQAKTSCSGNFHIKYDDYVPQFPVAVRIECPDPDPAAPQIRLTMQSRISREGSCNQCHHGNRDQKSPGWVICDASLNVFYPKPEASPPECSGNIEEWWKKS